MQSRANITSSLKRGCANSLNDILTPTSHFASGNGELLESRIALYSAIENIVTTHDELFKSIAFPEAALSHSAKEVRHYASALRSGYQSVLKNRPLTNAQILEIQATIEGNSAGFRKLPGTVLKDPKGRTVYTPPQDHARVVDLMRDLESFINEDDRFDADPLVKMAIIHHQFESIHPFCDGNGAISPVNPRDRLLPGDTS